MINSLEMEKYFNPELGCFATIILLLRDRAKCKSGKKNWLSQSTSFKEKLICVQTKFGGRGETKLKKENPYNNGNW